jgi:hypothetical protein
VILALAVAAAVVIAVDRFDWSGTSTQTSVQGSGVAATQARPLSPFTGVELAGSNNVVVHVGGPQAVVVRGDDNLLARVTTQVKSGTLVVGNTSGSFSAKQPMSVDVTVPALSALTLPGSGNIVVDGVDAQSLAVTLAGAGTMTASGTATRLDVTIRGSGTAQFRQLVASEVRAVVSGSGSIFVTATARLDATVSGTGSIIYGGDPATVTKNVTGTGAIVAGG